MREFQRSKIYRAERRFWDLNAGVLPIYDTMEEVEAEVKRIATLFPQYPIIRTIVCKPGFARSRACYRPDENAICIIKEQRTQPTIIHEICHAIAGYTNEPWHGKTFASLTLELTKTTLGEEFYSELKHFYDEEGIQYDAS